MKNIIKNLSIIAIIFSMLLALIPSAVFAAFNNNPITIKVNGDVSERTLSVYKLFTIDNVDEDENNYYYSWSDQVKAFFENFEDDQGNKVYGYETITEAVDAMKSFTSTQLDELASNFYKYATENGISPEVPSTTVASGATSKDLVVNGSGYYIIYDESETADYNADGTVPEGKKIAKSVAMINNVIKNMEVDLKVDEISIPEKKVNDQVGTSAGIGEIVEFTVTSKVPTMAGYESYDFDFIDTLSKGLTFYEDETHMTKVEIGEGENKKALYLKENNSTETPTTDVYFTRETEDGTTAGSTMLTISLKDLIKIKNENNNVGNVGDTITLTYYAKVNSDAIDTDTAGHTLNEVKLKYSNDPYNTQSHKETPPDVVHVYTYTVDFTKKNTSDEKLEGAKFVLKSGNKFVKYITENGKTEIELVDTQEEATVVTSDANGEFSFEGLKEGTYTLVETEAPEGYQVPNFDGFTFTITPTLNNDGTLNTFTFTYDNTEEIAKGFVTATVTSDVGSTTVAVEVLNAKEGFLPSTGGTGTKIFTTVGIVVMIVAAGALVYRNKKNN